MKETKKIADIKNIKTIEQATDYVFNELKELNPDVERDDVYDTIMDEILESSEYIMLDDDIRFLEDNEKDTTAIDDYFHSKLPSYKSLLHEIVADMTSEEPLDEE